MSALYKTGTVAWVRSTKDSEWILAYARGETWVYLLAGTTQLGNGSISPLTAPAQIRIVHLPAPEPEDTDEIDSLGGLPADDDTPVVRAFVASRVKRDMTEDADDVEPEPLKEDQHVLVWARVEDIHPDGEIQVAVEAGHNRFPAAHPYITRDAIVRPSAGQVPPWLVLPPLEEPKGIGAVVEAEVSGSDRHSFVRVDTADGTPCRWRSTYDGCGYEWAALKEPTLTRVGVPEDGAS